MNEQYVGLTAIHERPLHGDPFRPVDGWSWPVADGLTRTAALDPLRSLTTVSFRAVHLIFLLCHRLSRFLQLLPIRRVLMGLIVFGERFLGVALADQHIAPGF